MIQKVDDINRPLCIGEEFLVPCIVGIDDRHFPDPMQEAPFVTSKNSKNKYFITPVINLPHSDIENGQKEIHYHADFRFIKTEDINPDAPLTDIVLKVVNKHSKYFFCPTIRPEEKIHGNLEYIILPVVSEEFKAGTPADMIKKSKLKHKCIHKGKCPHRGYDLSQVKADNGIITCPLHGLIFDSITKNLLPYQ